MKGFNFFHLKDDTLIQEELARFGLVSKEFDINKYIPSKIMQTVSLEIILQHLVQNEQFREIFTPNSILGLEFFSPYKPIPYGLMHEFAKVAYDDWSLESKPCQWQYLMLVRLEDDFFLFEDELTCRFRYPPENGEGLFPVLAIPNSIKQYVNINDFEEKDWSIIPKSRILNEVNKSFMYNFRNKTALTWETI